MINPKANKIIRNILWLSFAIAMVVLLGAAVQLKNRQLLTTVKVTIEGAEEHLFVDEKDILAIINQKQNINQLPLHKIPLQQLEKNIEATAWVKNAEIFINNKKELEINIQERQPIARIFAKQGYSFYVDSTGKILPLSEKLSARVPMFTGFGGNIFKLSSPDSLVLQQIINISKAIVVDSFFMAQTAQIDITPQATFELIPTIGNHIVTLGYANDIASKLHRLLTFYKKAWLQTGINTYEKIDVQYSNQVVAIKRGTAKQIADSAAAKKALADMLAQSPNYTQVDSVATIANKPVKKDSITIKKLARVVAKKPTEKKLVNKKPENNKPIKKSLNNKGTTVKPMTKPAKASPKAVLPKTKNSNNQNNKG
jgi:cell division protein FtsQ